LLQYQHRAPATSAGVSVLSQCGHFVMAAPGTPGEGVGWMPEGVGVWVDGSRWIPFGSVIATIP
jgi:hypothetical protein